MLLNIVHNINKYHKLLTTIKIIIIYYKKYNYEYFEFLHNKIFTFIFYIKKNI